MQEGQFLPGESRVTSVWRLPRGMKLDAEWSGQERLGNAELAALPGHRGAPTVLGAPGVRGIQMILLFIGGSRH